MCDVASIVDQFKGMASLDYAALSNNLTREILVMALESPEMFDAISDIVEASKCIAETVSTDDSNAGEDGEENWNIFVSDVDVKTQQLDAAATA